MIIGFHGSGLANLVFATPGVSVIEIVDDCIYPSYKDGLIIPGRKATRTYFHMVSAMKGLRYDCISSDNYFLNLEQMGQKIEKLNQKVNIANANLKYK